LSLLKNSDSVAHAIRCGGRTIGRAIAAGVNYFDTAVQYGNGESEKDSQRGGRCEGRIERPVYSFLDMSGCC
jgi:diketogulonate reductase-like aldo/keto reductase